MTHTRPYRVLEHTADMGIELEAERLDEAIATAALAMFELMGQPQTAGAEVEITVRADGVDREDLLVGLLTELLGALELQGAYLEAVDEIIAEPPVGRHGDDALWHVALVGRGRRIDRDEERGLIEFKAITYHDIRLEPVDLEAGNVRWHLRVIFDL